MGKPVRAMVLVWLLFGVVVGAGSRPGEEGLVGVIAGVIAGVMVLPWLGAVLGLMGGRASEALGGHAGGEAEVLHKASACLAGGALTGATFPAVYRLLVAGWLGVLRACLRQAGASAVPANPA